MINKKYLAEFIGTFVLCLVVLLSVLGTFPIPTPVLAGIVVMIFVYTIGNISGTHLNPAVTIGAWSINKISSRDALYYLLSQTLAGFMVIIALFTFGISVDTNLFSNFFEFDLLKVVAEIVGTAILTFGIASVVFGQTSKDASGIVIGFSLIVGVAVSVMLGAGGILNPAVALALGEFGLTYLFGPIIGGVVGFNLYNYLIK